MNRGERKGRGRRQPRPCSAPPLLPYALIHRVDGSESSRKLENGPRIVIIGNPLSRISMRYSRLIGEWDRGVGPGYAS